jgi:tRNA pseudouridine13 synthase
MLPDQTTLAPAAFKSSPEDFVVEEIPAYPPSGSGEHLYLTFRKRLCTTDEAVRVLARALGADPRGCGYAGQKDKVGVTTQAATFPVPMKVDPAPLLSAFEDSRITVLDWARHNGKLKPGHLHGNRFIVVLRDVPAEAAEGIADTIRAAKDGFPNAFGPQRFGRDGDNPERALGWLAGKDRGPRDRRDHRMLFSALQSLLFNELLARRVADGSWSSILPGDVAKKHDTGGLFTVPASGPELEDAERRAREGLVSATGPIFGASMRWPEAEALALERAVLEARGLEPRSFDAFRSLGEGTRRPLRVFAEDVEVEPIPGGLRARFVLPKGTYATTLLGRACKLVETRYDRASEPTDAGPEA